ncbi:MAG: hypothetical protein AAFV29_07690 [Myxococcota bacterium]
MLSLAGAQRALAVSNDAIYVNPAGLAFFKTYAFESVYLDDFRGSDRRINASVVDSQAGPLAAGLAYSYIDSRPEELDGGDIRLEGHRFDLAVASLLAQSASIGLNLRYQSLKRTEDGEELEGSGFSVFNLDAGFQYRVTQSISLGVVGYNLIRNERPEMPLQAGGGLAFNAELFSIEGDVLYDFQAEKLKISAGLDFIISGAFPVRGGLSWDEMTGEWQISAGLGAFAREAAIDIGFRQSLNSPRRGEDSDARVFGVSVRGVFK